ncbi:MAG TPA: sensor histidine kinase [Cellulomonas sp.]
MARPTATDRRGRSAVDAATSPAARTVPSSERSEFWRRALAGWDTAFYALLAISAVSMLAVDPQLPPTGTTVTAVASLVVLLAAYLVLGRRGARRGDHRMTRGYLVVLIAVIAVTSGVNTVGSILLFIGFSQVWFFASGMREGVVASVLMAVVVCTSMVIGYHPDRSDLLVLVGQMGVGLLFSLALGWWITKVAEQSEERAGLIERLEAAQAELAVSNHAAGVLAERERMAQEIHDTLAQGFTSVVMLAQTAQAQIDRGMTPQAGERVAQIEQVARDNLAEARALVAAFGPAALADATLAEALERLGDRFGAETGVQVDVRLDGPSATGRDAEVVLLRAAQEALANVRRHAGARRVLLRLAGDGTQVTLEVVDDGQGLAPGTAEGVGLRGMRERVAAGGGTVDVSGEPGRGTRVRLALPLATTGAGTGPAARSAASPTGPGASGPDVGPRAGTPRPARTSTAGRAGVPGDEDGTVTA